MRKTLELGFLFALFISSLVHAQENIETTEFTTYGYIPFSVPDSLYTNLKNARSTLDSINVFYDLGNTHYQLGNPDSANIYASKLVSLLKRNPTNIIEPVLYRLRAYALLGNAKLAGGFLDDAKKAYLEGIALAGDKNYDPEIFNLKLGLASSYLNTGELEKAEKLLKKTVETATSIPIKLKANYLLGNLALEKEDFNTAETYYDASLYILDGDKMPKMKQQLLLFKGILYQKQKKYDTALAYFTQVMQESLSKEYYDLYTEAVLNYGQIYSAMGEIQAAEMVLSMAYGNALNWNRLELQKKIIKSLRDLYIKKGDYQNAYNLMTQYNAVTQELLNEENTRMVKDLEFKYETLQKENQIFELKEIQITKQNEIDRQKTIKKAFLYGFLILLVPIIGLLYVYYQKLQTQSELNIQQKELSNQKIASLLNEQELKLARTALDAQQEERLRISQQLHDGIGGNLAGIKLQLANMNDGGKTKEGIMKQVNDTYELVRDISHDLVPKKFAQNAFTVLIKEYLHKIAEHSSLSISFYAHPEEKIDTLPETVKVALYQIIQELTTNTIKHAQANTVELHLTISKNQLQLLFEDDGVGFNTKDTATGIGLDNITNRVKQLEGQLMIDSTPGRGTVFTITLNKLV